MWDAWGRNILVCHTFVFPWSVVVFSLFVVWCFSFCCVSFFFFLTRTSRLAPMARTLLGGLEHAMFNFFIVAARLFLVFASIHLLCCWSAHKSLAPRTRPLLGVLGQATLIFVALATLLFFVFCECPQFCDLVKQRRKTFVGVSEVGKIDFALYSFWLCVFFLVFYFLLLRSRATRHMLSSGELHTLADAVTAIPPPTTIRLRNIWVVVDASRHPPHQAPRGPAPPQDTRIRPHHTSVRAMDGLQGHAPPGHPSHRQTGSHCYTYGNGRADTHAKHQSTNHTPRLKHVRLDTPHNSHLQHLPPIPSATQPPQWIPEGTPYTDRDKQYHYPTPIQQLATTVGHPANTELLQRLKDSVRTPVYYSAIHPDSLPAHLQKPRLQLALKQLPLLTGYHRWYACRSIHIPARYTKCICGHAKEETWDHFKTCPLYRGQDTLTD